MVTELRKSVIRRTAGTFDHRKRRLIVRLEPGDVLSMKEIRTRKWFTAPLSRVFRQIVQWNVLSETTIKQLRRKKK